MIRADELYIDKTSAVPLYEQLRSGLLAAIDAGRLCSGEQLPTEEELCRSLGISRPVVQAACNALIRDGYVQRIRGKGTFIKIPDSRGRFIDKQLSFAREMEILGLDHRTEVIQGEWIECPKELQGKPGLSDGRWYRLKRLRYVSGQVFVLVENDIPESIFPGIDRYDFSKRSLYDIFEKEYLVKVYKARRKITAQTAGTEIASYLGLHRQAAVLSVENLVLDRKERIIDVSREYLDGASRSFEFDVYNQ